MTVPIGYFGNTLQPVFPPYHYTIPMIVWGDALDKTLEFGAPLEGPPVSYSVDRQGNEIVQTPDGADGWSVGYGYELAATAPWIPMEDDVTSYPAPVTGWYSVSGWHEYIKWGRQQKTAKFYPDRLVASFIMVYLIEPLTQRPDRGHRGGRRLPFKLRSATSDRFTGY